MTGTIETEVTTDDRVGDASVELVYPDRHVDGGKRAGGGGEGGEGGGAQDTTTKPMGRGALIIAKVRVVIRSGQPRCACEEGTMWDALEKEGAPT